MKKFLFIFIPVVLAALLVLGYLYINPDKYEKTGVRRIAVSSQDKKTSYGYVWIEDKKVKDSITSPEIKIFLESKKLDWENNKQKYATGGVTKDGGLWDSVKTTQIGDTDFMYFIWLQIYDNFYKNYHIELVDPLD